MASEHDRIRPERPVGSNYRWVIAALFGLITFLTMGFITNTRGLYLKVVTDELSISRSLYSVNDILRYVSSAVLSVLFGTLIAWLRPRRMIVVSVVVLAVSQVLYALAQDLTLIYIGGLLVGVGISGCSTATVSYVIGKWFQEHRGTVLGVILSTSGIGASVGTMLLRPVITGESSALGSTGWRTSYYIAAALMVVLLFVVLLLYRDAPENEAAQLQLPEKRRGRTWEGIPWKTVRRSPGFYLLCVSVLLGAAVVQSVYSVSTAHLEDVGLESGYITSIVGISSFLLFVAKVISGYSYDRLGLPVTMLLCHVAGAVATFLLAFVTPETPFFGLAHEILMPFGLPIETVMIPLIASELYGERSFAKTTGILVAVTYVGYTVGALVINSSFDALQTYRPILIVFAVVMVVTGVLTQVEMRRAGAARKAAEAAE